MSQATEPKRITMDDIGEYLDRLRAIAYAELRLRGDLDKSRRVSDVVQSACRGTLEPINTPATSAEHKKATSTQKKKVTSWENPQALLAYLSRAIKNKLYDYYKKRSADKRPKIDRNIELEQLEVAVPEQEMNLPPGFDEALRWLSFTHPRWADALWLLYYQEKTYAEAAELLDCATSSVKNYARLGIAALRRKCGLSKPPLAC
jgi:RNA polymerase sigma factor (sigma-70 family)